MSWQRDIPSGQTSRISPGDESSMGGGGALSVGRVLAFGVVGTVVDAGVGMVVFGLGLPASSVLRSVRNAGVTDGASTNRRRGFFVGFFFVEEVPDVARLGMVDSMSSVSSSSMNQAFRSTNRSLQTWSLMSPLPLLVDSISVFSILALR